MVLAAISLLACPAPTNPEVDAGEEVPVEYEGESGGSPPDFDGNIIDAGNNTPIDAGLATVDTRCCNLEFRIDSNGEPADAVGKILGEAGPFSMGVSLARVDGGYTASACFPMTQSSYYWYQFEYFSDDAGSGGLDLGDGGYRVTDIRYNPDETNYPVGGDNRQNYIPSVMSCAQLDAGMGP